MSGPGPWADVDGLDVLVRVKAVPGASRDAIAGVLGDRLKVRVAAPPEDGKANAAIAGLLAAACGVQSRAVTIESGQAQPHKCFRVRGAPIDRVLAIVG